jgi:hypothetical protein
VSITESGQCNEPFGVTTGVLIYGSGSDSWDENWRPGCEDWDCDEMSDSGGSCNNHGGLAIVSGATSTKPRGSNGGLSITGSVTSRSRGLGLFLSDVVPEAECKSSDTTRLLSLLSP